MREWSLAGGTITVGISSFCGARCICCPFDDFPLRNQNMDNDLFVKCIDEAYEHGMRYLDLCLMGDSLLDPNKEFKLSYVRRNYPDVKIYASSTGMSADPEFVKDYVDTLHVSFYGMTKEVYEKVHRGGVKFEKALDNIEKILAMPKTMRPYVVLTFLVLPENEHQLGDWKEKWEPIADEIIVWKPHNWAGLYPTDSCIVQDFSIAKSCNRPFGGPLCVWVNGDVTVCCFSWDKDMVIGNLYDQTLEEIYHGPKRKEIQRIHEKNMFSECKLPCKKCDQIFPREDALVYTNHNRKTGHAIMTEEYSVEF